MKKFSMFFCWITIILILFLSVCASPVPSRSSSHPWKPSDQQLLQWNRLTKENFTSDIKRHPFVLCIATVPWCGESRSIMNELLTSIEADKHLKALLQLRVVYVNLDKDLGFNLTGKKKSPIFILYRHAIPYRYMGKLKPHNILLGIRHGTSILSEDLPFKRLHSFSEVENFMLSTDKGVILFDFCGWAQKVHHKTKRILHKGHTTCKDIPFLSAWQEEVPSKKDIEMGFMKLADSKKHEEKTKDPREQIVRSRRQEDVQKMTDKVDKLKNPSSSGENKIFEDTFLGTPQMCALHDQQKFENENFLGGANHQVCSSKILGKESVVEEMGSPGSNEIPSVRNQLRSESGFHDLCNDCKSQTDHLPCKTSDFENSLQAAVLIGSNYGAHFGQTNCGRSGLLRQNWCNNRTEYQQFVTMFRNLTKIARSHVLTPELVNFGIVRDNALLSNLKVARLQNCSWFLMLQVTDQLHDPVFYFGDGEMDSFIFGQPLQLVPEVNSEFSNHPSSFSNDTALLLLFIDRASPSLMVRQKSWEALKAIQVVARDYVGSEKMDAPDVVAEDMKQEQMQMDGSDDIKIDISTQMQHSVSDSGELHGLLASWLELSSVEGSTLHVQGSGGDKLISKTGNLRSVLHKKDTGMFLQFLLGGERQMQPDGSITDVTPGHLLALDLSQEVASGHNVLVKDSSLDEKDNIGSETFADLDDHARDVKDEDKTKQDSSSGVVEVLKPVSNKIFSENELLASDKLSVAVGSKTDEHVENGKVMHDIQREEPTQLSGNSDGDSPEELKHVLLFYFVDGDSHLKDRILHGFDYPSVVILDPFEGGQYMFPSNQSISQSSLKEFVNSFVKNSLHKTYRSESTPQSPRMYLPPPFVNRDFHAANGVPQVTVNTFSEMVLGSHAKINIPHSTLHETLDTHKEEMSFAWKKDVLVHFTAPWCGFCKKMELVFCEVHRLLMRALDGNVRTAISEQSSREVRSLIQGNMQLQYEQLLEGPWADKSRLDTEDDLPILLQMDCTGNDCSGLLKGIVQEELYPSVILFPARRKDLPIVFQGGPTVHEIIEFLMAKGTVATGIHHRVQEQTQKKRSNAKNCSLTSLSSKRILIDSTAGDGRHVYDFTADAATEQLSAGKNPMSSVVVNDRDSPKIIIYPTVGSVLVATEKLSKPSTVFSNSIILIVKADGMEGFQGLIVNKPLLWNIVPGLDSEMEPLVNNTVLCYGGPVILHGQLFLSLTRLKDFEGFLEVVPGIQFGGPVVTRNVFQSIKEGKVDANNFWFFLGCAGWSWQQLLDELSEQVWQLSTYREGLIDLPVQKWQDGANIRVSDLLGRNSMGQ